MKLVRDCRIVLPLAGLLAGCAHYQDQPLSAIRVAAEFEERSLDNPALKTFLEQNLHRQLSVWPIKTWDFQSLALAAFYYHPSLDVARAQWNVAQAGMKTAGGRPNPT